MSRDLDLIYLKSENARMSLKELSNHLNKTPQRLKYSLSVLQKEGTLKYPHCIFEYSSFGLILFRVYFRGSYINEQERKEIIELLNSNPYLTSIYEFTGEYDLTAEFICPNPSKFNKELKRISSLKNTLSDFKVILNLVTHLYSRDCIAKNTSLKFLNPERVLGGDREKEEFNENELAVMKQLLLHPTMGMGAISKEVKINVKTVRSIVQKLKKKNILKGFKYATDANNLGINRYRLFLKLHHVSQERESKIVKFALDTKEIVQLNKTIGDWDIELDIEAVDKNRIRQILLQLREEFKELIEKSSQIDFYDYHKLTYLPNFLFEGN
ncbi:MAG: Lrp/AsnC family transcriptional regulator [Candidatus Woesearchaeota archaeon]